MISVQTKSHICADGTLALHVPTALRETDVDVTLVAQPVPQAKHSPEELGWPPGFFEETYGSLRDEPLNRLPQGDFEEREPVE